MRKSGFQLCSRSLDYNENRNQTIKIVPVRKQCWHQPEPVPITFGLGSVRTMTFAFLARVYPLPRTAVAPTIVVAWQQSLARGIARNLGQYLHDGSVFRGVGFEQSSATGTWGALYV